MDLACVSKAISTNHTISATNAATRTATLTTTVHTSGINYLITTHVVTTKPPMAPQAEAAGSATTTSHVSSFCIISQGNFSKAHGDWGTRANSQ